MPPKRVTYVAALGLMIGAYGAPSGTGTAEAQCGARDISGPQGVDDGAPTLTSPASPSLFRGARVLKEVAANTRKTNTATESSATDATAMIPPTRSTCCNYPIWSTHSRCAVDQLAVLA